MLTIFHTADWHIGQNFYGYDRKEEHLYFFNWLKTQVKDKSADVLIVAGDVFDSPNPSAESQKVYYRFLHEITFENPQLQIIIIAGNHDSAARLDAPNPLLEEMNINVKVIKRKEDGEIDFDQLFVPLKQGNETLAWCIAVPYLRQGDYPPAESYSKGIALMYESLYMKLEEIRDKKPVIVTGHLQTQDSIVSDKDRSEKAIIGGLECISSNIFIRDYIAYTALGHLHKHQYVAEYNIQYAGSPLPMSFAEIDYKHGVNMVKLNSEGLESIERLNFEPLTKLLSIPAEPMSVSDVLLEIAKLPDGEINNTSPYLDLKILITEPEPSIRNKLNEAVKGKSVKLATTTPYKIDSDDDESTTLTYEDLKTIDPTQIAKDVFKREYSTNMPDNMIKLLQDVIREVED